MWVTNRLAKRFVTEKRRQVGQKPFMPLPTMVPTEQQG
jgi:hypothetical protein